MPQYIRAFVPGGTLGFTVTLLRQMITFGVLRWNDSKGGMRFAFPPYGPSEFCLLRWGSSYIAE
jgi:hypothetical protein